MRVGFDARWYNESGVGVYVAELLGAMATIAHEKSLELIAYEDPLNPVPDLAAQAVTRIRVKAPKYSLASQLEFRFRSQQDRLDVFHCPFYAAPLALRCPLVITVHDLIPFIFRIYRRPKQALVKLGYRTAIKRARHVIADSANTAGDLHRVLKVRREEITTIRIAAARDYSPTGGGIEELEKLRAKYNIDSRYVMVSSARNWRTKNLQGALRALQIAVRQCGIKFQTVVYGPTDGIDALGPSAGEGLDLRRAGHVPRCDLAALFRHAEAFLMPSRYEGFGLPILEAMSCGCPVVTSNAGSLPEVAAHGAQVFSPDDSEAMGGAIAALLQSPEHRRRWQAAALARAADFSWARAAAETISVYHRVHSQAVSNRSV
jgi:glycosyltransferase involved in cell wall biosynthesis